MRTGSASFSETPARYGRGSDGHRAPPLVAEIVKVRLAGSLHLTAIAAFALAVIALILGKHLVATVLFVIASAGFLATIVLQRRR
jgi:hypothetical protein